MIATAEPTATIEPRRATRDDLHRSVLEFSYPAFSALREGMTVQQALDRIRQLGFAQRIVYFYVLDEEHRLVGVLPTRRLLISQPDAKLGDVMIRRLVFLKDIDTIEYAARLFSEQKFLALPVVNDDRQVVGVIDIEIFAGELDDIYERTDFDDVYQTVGFNADRAMSGTPIQRFRYRFPWLITTICSGTAAAVLSGLFEATLQQAIVIAFFLTLVLGLAESVSMQSMTLTLQRLHGTRPSWPRFRRDVSREWVIALLLGLSCGAVVGTIALIWQRDFFAAATIGASICISMVTACLIGLIVPVTVHAMQRDPKIAAGPVTLALTDLSTLAIYFTLASVVLT